LEFDIVVLIYFRTKTFELLSNPLQKQKINSKIMACVRNVCLYFAALVSVYLLACVEPCFAYFFPVKKPEGQTVEIRNIPCLVAIVF